MSGEDGTSLSWTPNEAWLFAEMARRALVATLDGGLPRRSGLDESAPFRATVQANEDAVRLVLSFKAKREVTLRLDPVRVDHHVWRDHWVVQVERPSESWTLSARGEVITIADPRRSDLIVHLRTRRLALDLDLDGEREIVPLEEVAFHRYTKQSSDDGRFGPYSFAPRTKPEVSPFWEIDLGAPWFIAHLSFRLDRLPPDARVLITAYTFAAKRGGPPEGSFARSFDVSTLPVDRGDLLVEVRERIPARLVRISVRSANEIELPLHVLDMSALAATPFPDSLRATMRRAFALHRERTLFASSVDNGPTYGEAWARASAIGRGIANIVEPPTRADGRVVMVVVLDNGPDWIACDLIAIERGWVMVPLSPHEDEGRLTDIVRRVRPDVVVCTTDRLEVLTRGDYGVRLAIVCDQDSKPPRATVRSMREMAETPRAGAPPISTQPEDALFTILFTSGSTGRPKGAMRSYRTFRAMLESYGLTQWPRHLSFQPLSHLSERMVMPWLLVCGATIAFSRGGEHLMEELQAFGPTELGSVPRLYDVLYARYHRRLGVLRREAPDAPAASVEAKARAEARAAFGPGLRALSVGSAPSSPEVLAFVRECFADIWVSEGYGSTEVGTIAVDGKIASNVDVKLVPLADWAPDADGNEVGEIWVRSSHVITGYLGDDGEPERVVDDEGFFATGDLGERGMDGTVRVIGRVRNTVKLAQGEFVSAERIETALVTAPSVDRIFVHAEGGAAGVSALVFTSRAPSESGEMLSSLRAHGRAAGLAPWELPRGLVIENEAPSVANGMATTSGKLARGVLAARYGRALSELTKVPLASIVEVPAESLEARLAAVVRRVTGRSVDPSASFDAAGIDSLSVAEVLSGLSEELGRDVPLSLWFEASSLVDLAARLGERGDRIARATMALIDADRRPMDVSCGAPRRTNLPRIVVTGATGLLGAHLVEALLHRSPKPPVLCLVRGDDDEAAAARFDAALAKYGVVLADRGQVHVLASDLTRPRLGLAPSVFESLKEDVILHSAAAVSWLAPYAKLREPNIHGTQRLIELGAELHFISTISTAPVGGDESSMLDFDDAVSSSPYGLTKWIAEEHVRRACGAGLPATIYRPGMISGHTTRGRGNAEDFIHRYLKGVVELGVYVDDSQARLDMTPVDFVARAVVALVLDGARGGRQWADTYHLVNVDQSLTYGALGRALREIGFDVRPASYAAFRDELMRHRSSRLGALGPYFPAGRFTMAMGPWPSERTRDKLASLGVAPAPQIDARILEALMRGLSQT